MALHGGTGITNGAPSGPTSPTVGEIVCVFKDAASAACPTTWALSLPGDPPPPYNDVSPPPASSAPYLTRNAHPNYTVAFKVPPGSTYIKPPTITNAAIVGELRTIVTVHYS